MTKKPDVSAPPAQQARSLRRNVPCPGSQTREIRPVFEG
jgi:hypothetical protein